MLQVLCSPFTSPYSLSPNASLHFMALGFMAAENSRYSCALAIRPGKEPGHSLKVAHSREQEQP